ncbi:MAG: transposase [Ruminococcaceae bacterium]|nr:transposase [Oscillospiraceae bacterium]
MPRKARVKSESGIYHVMLRGINQQQIFEDSEDYDKFLQTLKECKEICGYKLYAYCLMGNHIHLLMREGHEPLEQVFKRICGRFVYWYNTKYQRAGHLFQDRFKSEPVDSEQYFFTVLRYIHQNPTKAGLCKRVDEYAYSSYLEYIDQGDLVDTDYILQQATLDEFIGLHSENADASCLDISDKVIRRVTDEQAKALIKKISKCENVSDFQSLDLNSRNKYLHKLKEEGVSIRQLSRLTGIGFNVVKKY